MRIAVVDLVSTDGGRWIVLRDLHRFAVDPRNVHDWLFVLGPQELDGGERVRVARFPRAKAGPFGRLWSRARPAAPCATFDPTRLFLQTRSCWESRDPGWCISTDAPVPDRLRFSFFRRGEFESAVRQHLHGRIIRKSVASADGVFVQTEWMREAVSRVVSGRTPVVNAGLPGLPEHSDVSRAERGPGVLLLLSVRSSRVQELRSPPRGGPGGDGGGRFDPREADSRRG